MYHLARRWIRRSGIFCLVIALLTACTVTAPVKEQPVEEMVIPAHSSASVATPASLRTLARMQQRLDEVAAPLLLQNTVACKRNARNLLGFTAKNRYSYSSDLSEMAATALGLSEHLQITSVMPDSGAARVGLQRGDRLLAVAGIPVPQGEEAEYRAPAFLAPHLLGDANLPLTVQRGKKRISVRLPLTRACGFSVELGNSDEVNFFVDGQRIMVTRGIMQFARTDDELAYVIAKGMAHNVLQHPQQLKMVKAAHERMNDLHVGTTRDSSSNASRLMPVPSDKDVLADRLSLYMLVRAGYDIDAAPSFWQRLANSSTAKCFTSLHPATDTRLNAMRKTLYDIKLARIR